MKKLIYTIPLLFLLLAVTSCQNETNEVDGHGYLQLSSVEVNKDVVVESGASARMAERTGEEQLALDIYKGTERVKHVEDWTQLREEAIQLEVGEYTLRAYSFGDGKSETAQGVGAAAFYMGETKVTIVKDVNQTVQIKCKLSQSMVTLNYSANFKKAFPTYSATLINSYGSVAIPSTETRSAYMGSGVELTAKLNLTNTDGNSFEVSRVIAEKAQSHYHYKVNYDVATDGKGDFTVEVDPVAKIHEITVKIPIEKIDLPDPILTILAPDAWGKFAYMTGKVDLAPADAVVTFKYRPKGAGDDAWVEVASTLKEGVYEAKTEEINFGSDYEYVMVCGETVSTIAEFTTEKFEAIPNLNFDGWSVRKFGLFIKKDFISPNANGADSFWESGNQGTITAAKINITTEAKGSEARNGSAAKMTTVPVDFAGVAAGNIFTGSFNTEISNPSASPKFGQRYNGARPTKLSGYFRYDPQPMSYGTKPGGLEMDQCHIYVELLKIKNFNAKKHEERFTRIGYAEFSTDQKVDTYTKFETGEIQYYDMVTKPDAISIVATSSRYGGLFDGVAVVGQVGVGSTLWVDDFELSYYK